MQPFWRLCAILCSTDEWEWVQRLFPFDAGYDHSFIAALWSISPVHPYISKRELFLYLHWPKFWASWWKGFRQGSECKWGWKETGTGQGKKMSVFVCTLWVPEESEQGWSLSSIVAEQNVLGRDECSWRAEKRLMECMLLMKEKSRPS